MLCYVLCSVEFTITITKAKITAQSQVKWTFFFEKKLWSNPSALNIRILLNTFMCLVRDNVCIQTLYSLLSICTSNCNCFSHFQDDIPLSWLACTHSNDSSIISFLWVGNLKAEEKRQGIRNIQWNKFGLTGGNGNVHWNVRRERNSYFISVATLLHLPVPIFIRLPSWFCSDVMYGCYISHNSPRMSRFKSFAIYLNAK